MSIRGIHLLDINLKWKIVEKKFGGAPVGGIGDVEI
jgi:hypothetical protein